MNEWDRPQGLSHLCRQGILCDNQHPKNTMAKHVRPTPSIYQTIDRPVILQVVRKLMNDSQISNQTKINFFGPDDQAMMAGSGDTTESTDRFPFDERVFVEISMMPDEVNTFDYTRTADGRMPYFHDETLDLAIYPIYQSTKVAVSIKYRTIDRNQALSWKNMMSMRTRELWDLYLHSADFQVKIPEAMLAIVKEVWRKRETQGGYGETLNQYFTRNLTSAAQLVSDQAQNNASWVVSEKLHRIQGYFDFSADPEAPAKEGDHVNHQVGFTYTFTFDRIVQVGVKYPIFVHNQLIDQRLIAKPNVVYQNSWAFSRSVRERALDNFGSDNRLEMVRQHSPTIIPDFDDWRRPGNLQGCVQIAQMLVAITPDDKKSLIDLNDLGDFRLGTNWLNFILSEKQFVVRQQQSVLQLVLYEGNHPVHENSLTISDGGMVSAVSDLDIRKTYHLILHMTLGLETLTVAAIRRIIASPAFCNEYAQTRIKILPYVGNRSDVIRKQILTTDAKILSGQLDPAVSRGDPTLTTRSMNSDYRLK